MNAFGQATMQALKLLGSGDAVPWSIIGVSFSVSLCAIAIGLERGRPCDARACANTVVAPLRREAARPGR